MQPQYKFKGMKSYTQTVIGFGGGGNQVVNVSKAIKLDENRKFLTGLLIYTAYQGPVDEHELTFSLSDNNKNYWAKLPESFLQKDIKWFSEQFLPCIIPVKDNEVKLTCLGNINAYGVGVSILIVAQFSDIPVVAQNFGFQVIDINDTNASVDFVSGTQEFVTTSGYRFLKGIILLPFKSSCGTLKLLKDRTVILDELTAEFFQPKTDVGYVDSLFELNLPIDSSLMTISLNNLQALTGNLNKKYKILFVLEK